MYSSSVIKSLRISDQISGPILMDGILFSIGKKIYIDIKLVEQSLEKGG